MTKKRKVTEDCELPVSPNNYLPSDYQVQPPILTHTDAIKTSAAALEAAIAEDVYGWKKEEGRRPSILFRLNAPDDVELHGKYILLWEEKRDSCIFKVVSSRYATPYSKDTPRDIEIFNRTRMDIKMRLRRAGIKNVTIDEVEAPDDNYSPKLWSGHGLQKEANAWSVSGVFKKE